MAHSLSQYVSRYWRPARIGLAVLGFGILLFPAAALSQTSSVYAGKRLAIRMIGDCEKDPDPIGFFSDDIYDDCEASTLEAIRGKIVSAFSNKGVFASVGDGDADLVLTVTLIKFITDSGMGGIVMGGIVGDLTATTKMSANYALADSTGQVLTSGTASDESSNTDDDDAVEQQFAEKVAAAFFAQSPVATPSASSVAATQLSPWQLQVNAASTESYFDLLAQGYRSLPVKPSLPDEARAEKLKAEAALKGNNLTAAGRAYMAALNSAIWWPEGRRQLALILAQANKLADAIIDMRLYLKFSPDAPDAVQMEAKIAEWARIAPPPPPPPTSILMPPGMRIFGVTMLNTPSIVASAMNKPDLEGALILFVLTGSPAEKAGVVKGDVVVSCDDKPVTGAADFQKDVKDHTPGTNISLGIIRGQQQLTLSDQY